MNKILKSIIITILFSFCIIKTWAIPNPFSDPFISKGIGTVFVSLEKTDIVGGKSVKLNYFVNNGGSGGQHNNFSADIYYTLDGSDPKEGVLYEDEILLTDAGVYKLRAIALNHEYMKEEETEEEIEVKPLSLPRIIFEGNTVYITSAENGEIHYTADGSNPDINSPVLYTNKFDLRPDEKNIQIKAIAIAKGYAISEVAELDVINSYQYVNCLICGSEFEINTDEYNIESYICSECEEIDFSESDTEDEFLEDVYEDFTEEIFKEIVEEENFEENENAGYLTSDWAKAEVDEAFEEGLIPKEMTVDSLIKKITRKEFAAIAVKLYEYIVGNVSYVKITETPFVDFSEFCVYNDYIGTAYSLGITNGIERHIFSPDANISREQLATMLYRVIELAEQNGYGKFSKNFDHNNVRKFSDHTKISAYAEKSVYFMAEYGIIKGVDGANFAPIDTATKEQAIIISNRIIHTLF